MNLAPGTRIGPYELVAMVGAGGMGEVYRAHDARLGRDVALKILPTAFASDPERIARFDREARTLATLNHPHIGAIYGVEETNGLRALALEFVEGETLADRIARGPIPLEEALPFARQITEALEAAHERGIIHRDLKPANIKITQDGVVKVLDFGLAKLAEAPSGVANPASPSLSPTITSPALMTQAGMLVGTAAYMAPEQAKGRPADKRSDIWAFGCVVYEMLSGQRAFEGSEVSDTLASILKSEPEWSALPAETPQPTRRLLRRCLEKEPRRRLHDIADVRLDLEEPMTQDAPPLVAPPTSFRERAAWAVAALAVVSLVGFLAYGALKPPPGKEVTRFQVYAPSAARPEQVVRGSFGAVSPDGTRLVFVAGSRAGEPMLWMRAFDSFDALPVVGTEGASLPFWEPHGESIAFFVGNKLRRISTRGGPAQTICDVGERSRGGTWGSGGDIVFSGGSDGRLYRVSADGGGPVALAAQAGHGMEAFWPHFLPDGRTVLYWARNASEGPGVYAAAITERTAPKRLVNSGSGVAYDPSGFLLFTRGDALLRQRFDPTRLEVSGEARQVAERVARVASIGLAAFSVSNNGVLAFQTDFGVSTQFAWFDRSGQRLETVGAPGRYLYPALSPDGRHLVFLDLSDGNLWLLDMGRQLPSRFTSGAGMKGAPVWSPDGKTILYRRDPEGEVPPGIYEKSAGGAFEEKLFFKGSVSGPSQVSRDGKWLLYFAFPDGQSVHDIYALPMTGDKNPKPIVRSPFADVEPQFSPDGKFLAYASSATGRYELYVEPFPATGERWRISNNGGRQALWRADGKELFFVSDDKKFYAVEIKPGPRFDYGTPQFLFDLPANVTNVRNSYIPSPDGKRFLVNMALDTTAPPVHVVKNWTAELRD